MNGLCGLWNSKKAMMSLIILACSTVAVMTNKITGLDYSVIIGTIAVIYNFVQHRLDMKSNNE